MRSGLSRLPTNSRAGRAPAIFGHNDCARTSSTTASLWLIDFEPASHGDVRPAGAPNAGMSAQNPTNFGHYGAAPGSTSAVACRQQCPACARGDAGPPPTHLDAPGIDYAAYTTENPGGARHSTPIAHPWETRSHFANACRNRRHRRRHRRPRPIIGRATTRPRRAALNREADVRLDLARGGAGRAIAPVGSSPASNIGRFYSA